MALRSFVSRISVNSPVDNSIHRSPTQVTQQEPEVLKSERFWNFFTMTTAITYGIALVMLGCSFYLADIFIFRQGVTRISEVFIALNGSDSIEQFTCPAVVQ